ncbi:MAG: 50S ribosomal protein L18 [Caldisericaceae bacterium]
MINKNTRTMTRRIRHERIRQKLVGTEARPRLSVYISLNNVYAQIIDDEKGATLVSASTVEKEIKNEAASMNLTNAAKLVGETIAKRALEKGIKEVVFDRGGYLYHGRIKALADEARNSGLKF